MYATKEECRRCLLLYKKYIKLSVFAKEYKLPVTNLSMFLKGNEYDYYFSVSRLNGFITYIRESLTYNIL